MLRASRSGCAKKKRKDLTQRPLRTQRATEKRSEDWELELRQGKNE
jgi:hypothetical protein